MTTHAFKILGSNFVDLSGLAPILGITEIACALICLRKDGCSSFFYHADKMRCIPRLSRQFNHSLLDHQTGNQYYVHDCDKDWELINGACYYFETEEMNYEQAERNCLEKGGYLANINSDAEKNLFVALGKRGSFWVGGKKENGTWYWQDGTPISSKYWAPGEPAESAPCVQQWRSKGLDDSRCRYFKFSLCEEGFLLNL